MGELTFRCFALGPWWPAMEKSRQCLEPRPVDIARVAVALTVIVGGVLHATGVATPPQRACPCI